MPSSSPDTTPPVLIPQFNRDPVASLRPTTLLFEVGGQSFETKVLTATDWLTILMGEHTGTLTAITQLMEQEDVRGLVDAYIAHGGDLDELMFDLLEAASGRRWWVAINLVGAALGSWHSVGAALIADGVDPNKLSLAAWLDVFTVTLLEKIKPEEATMLMMKVEIPPDGVEVPDEALEMSADQFLSLG